MNSKREKTLISWVLSAIILIVIFLIGFQLGRFSLRQQMLELEATAKSTGWWNMQLEEEVQTLREELNFYVEEDVE